MLRYLTRRAASAALLVLVTSIVIFLLMRVIPGDPAQLLLGDRPGVSQEDVDRVRRNLGLDQPLPVQYLIWVTQAVQGNFGESLFEQDTVANAVFPRLVPTVGLTLYAGTIAIGGGIILGLISAVKRNTRTDAAISAFIVVMQSIPSYVAALVLVVVFAVELHWFPSLGLGHGLVDAFYYLTLPAIALGLSSLAFVGRVTRVSMIDALALEYVETARSRGLSPARVVLKHALRSGLIPILTVSGLLVGYLLSGAVIVESIFGISGIGSLLIKSVLELDYPVVQAIVVLIVVEFTIINFVVDLLYAVIDPRVRLVAS